MPKHRKRSAPELSPWRRVHVDVPAEAADAISGLLVDEGSLGLETEDDETRAVPGKAAVLTGWATITATFSREAGLEARIVGAIRRLSDYVERASEAKVEWSDLWPEDWNAIFRQHWKPFRCGKRIWVCPSWERDSFRAERVGEGPAPIVLYLDAGMAFGTGTHETTQLCIEAFEDAKHLGRVLDVGTGTGILSIAALKLGAQSARGTDIDPVAVSAALENAANNGVKSGFSADARAPDVDGAAYDCVVANILAGTLIELVDVIVASVKRGGSLWLSGVLVEQERAVREAYVAHGLAHVRTATKNGWVRIDFVKASA
jgi:ribosomal protein L11 methyltransferase